MSKWIVLLLFFYIILLPVYSESKAPQPSGYIGCYSRSIANFVNKVKLGFNSGTFCIGFCQSSEYRLAATQGNICYCAVKPTYIRYGYEDACNYTCPGRVTEQCGGKDSVSLYDTKYSNVHGPKKTETSTIDSVTNLLGASFTNGATGNTWTGSLSTQASNTASSPKIATSASAANWFQMTSGYIWLPVVILVACSILLFVWMIIRHKRVKSEALVNRREDPAMYFTQASEQNVMSDNHNYQTLSHENSLYMDSSSQIMAAVSNCGAEYITPVHSNDTAEYLVPACLKTAEYVTLVDSNGIVNTT